MTKQANGIVPACTMRAFEPAVLDAEWLEERFGSDEAFGVWFEPVWVDGRLTDETYSVFPDGSSATVCTNYALHIQKSLPGHEVRVVGFSNERNPDCDAVREGWHPGGHDFAMIDGRWLVDPWVRLVAGERAQIVYDLTRDAEARAVAQTYGDPRLWTELCGDPPRDAWWDRTGLEAVIKIAAMNKATGKPNATGNSADDGKPTASWVVREKATGNVLFETFDRKKGRRDQYRQVRGDSYTEIPGEPEQN